METNLTGVQLFTRRNYSGGEWRTQIRMEDTMLSHFVDDSVAGRMSQISMFPSGAVGNYQNQNKHLLTLTNPDNAMWQITNTTTSNNSLLSLNPSSLGYSANIGSTSVYYIVDQGMIYNSTGPRYRRFTVNDANGNGFESINYSNSNYGKLNQNEDSVSMLAFNNTGGTMGSLTIKNNGIAWFGNMGGMKLGINTNSPTEALEVNGSAKVINDLAVNGNSILKGAVYHNIRVTSSSGYYVASDDYTIVLTNNSATSCYLLPSSGNSGLVQIIKYTGSSSVTIYCDGSDLFENGLSSKTISTGERLMLQCSASGVWYVIAN